MFVIRSWLNQVQEKGLRLTAGTRRLNIAKGRPIPPLTLEDGLRETLVQRFRRSRTAQASARRARIILSGADGPAHTLAAAQVGVSQPTVGMWRSRFLAEGLDGLLDEPHSGHLGW